MKIHFHHNIIFHASDKKNVFLKFIFKKILISSLFIQLGFVDLEKLERVDSTGLNNLQ